MWTPPFHLPLVLGCYYTAVNKINKAELLVNCLRLAGSINVSDAFNVKDYINI